MSHRLTLEHVVRYSGKSSFERGMSYYESGAVLELDYVEEINTVEALVKGSKGGAYQVDVELDLDLDEEHLWVEHVYCSCPAFYSYLGYCKHIVALLIHIYYHGKVGLERTVVSDVDQILQYYRLQEARESAKELQLEVTLYLRKSWLESRPIRSLSLRVGEKRLYVVQNLEEFIRSVFSGRELHFGKHFTYNPMMHRFSSQDRILLYILKEVFEWHYLYDVAPMRKKELNLSEATFPRALQALQDKSFNLVINQSEFRNVTIQEEELPLELFLSEGEEYLQLTWMDNEDPLVPLSGDGRYWFYKGKVYSLSRERWSLFAPFFQGLVSSEEETMLIEKERKGEFLGKILPYLEKAGKVEIQDSIQREICRVPLRSLVYLDYCGGLVTARVRFCYGEQEIDPLQGDQGVSQKGIDGSTAAEGAFNNGEVSGGLIPLRQRPEEEKLLQLLGNCGFKQAQDPESAEKVYAVEGEEGVYNFLIEGLPQIKEEAEVYYTDRLGRLRIRPSPGFQGSVRLSSPENWLEIELGLEGIEREELVEVWKARREKRKYHRLKDGSFVPLEGKGLDQMERVVDELDLSERELRGGKARLHQGHALYTEDILKQEGAENFSVEEGVHQLAENIKELQEEGIALPSYMQGVLRSYQEYGYRWLKTLSRVGLGGILADDMGLGKTLQALAFMLSQKEEGIEGPALVIAPTSVLYNWEAEASRFAPGLKTLVVTGTLKERQKLLQRLTESSNGYDLLITSYSLLRRDVEYYEELVFNTCFLDEAQNIKNPSTQAAASVRRLRASTFFALTGTPVENSLVELWSIFSCILPGYLPSYRKFIKQYAPAENGEKGEQERVSQKLARKVAPFILRRTKVAVLEELPPKIERIFYSELTREQKKIYLAYLENLRSELSHELQEQGLEKNRIKILAGLTRLRQICCHPSLFLENYAGESGKLQQLRELLEELRGEGHRILLFSQFTSMLQIIKGNLEGDGYKIYYLDGSVKTGERLQMADSFNRGDKEIFLVSLKAGGTGLNLTGADTVIQYDLWWNPAVEKQAADRAHRIGQENEVQVIKMLTKDTIEEKIYRMQQDKEDLIERVVKPGGNPLHTLQEDELRELLEL